MGGDYDMRSRRPVTSVRVHAVDHGDVREKPDKVVTEEPLEIRVQGPRGEPAPVAVTMRTPGNDFELAVGFLLTEGVLESPNDVTTVAYCLEGQGEQQYNVVTVQTRSEPRFDPSSRRFGVSASCGLCGKATLDDVTVSCAPVAEGPVVPRSLLVSLPARLRDEQPVFDVTGGLHAAACFSTDGALTALREDVGRHNALDKVIGTAALEDALPLADRLLLVSGRVSFEIVQKAAVGGIPVICAVSAPSSLAVEAADRLGQTLVGFLRGDRFNVYSHPERVDTR